MKKLTIILSLLFISCTSMSSIKNKTPAVKFLWIKDLRTLVAILDNKAQNISQDSFGLRDSQGDKIKISSISKSFKTLEISLEKDLSLARNIILEYKGAKVYGHYSLEMMEKNFTNLNKNLGVQKNLDSYSFALWSPHATEVELLVYSPGDGDLEYKKKLLRGENGIFETLVKKKEYDVHMKHYMYKVTAHGKTNIALDPYAKSMSAYNPKSGKDARGVVIDLSAKQTYSPIKNLANELDFIGMEAHIRDFSHFNDTKRGSYKGFEESLDYFSNLGVTHIQLMPLQNFHTVNESDRSFQGDKQSKNNINYNWGYDPQNYFTPEGWYSLEPTNPMSRVNELKNLVNKIHSSGIGVILDVVYNHIYDHNIFEKVSPGSYLRRNSRGDISYHSGAGASLESRNPMVRRLMIDSLKFWKDFYKIDGYRFDLMGFHDKETMVQIRKALGHEMILYGEAWEFTDLPSYEATTKSNLPRLANLSAFNDTSRDAYTGVMENKGFVQGNFVEIPKVKAGIIAGIRDFPSHNGDVSEDRYHRFAHTPSQTLNYLTIHDGFTLWDKINLSLKATKEERLRRVRQALAMLMTSQGKLILHGGIDLGRSKPLAKNDPERSRAHTTSEVNAENGIRYFHENTYKSPDTTNKVNWDRADDFLSLNEYTKGLIHLRRSLPSLRFLKLNSIKNGLKFISSKEDLAAFKKESQLKFDYAGYKSFTDKGLNKLEVEFINAPDYARNKSYFIAGEIHPKNTVKNPKNNPFEVHFDKNGYGALKLNLTDLKKLDLSAWSDPDGLQFKLVEIPGQWKTINSSYTPTGNNKIHPSKILKGNKAIIDLSIVNHEAGKRDKSQVNYIAYELDNTLENETAKNIQRLNLKKVIVIHNGGDKSLYLDVESIVDPKQWKVYLDNKNSGVKAINNSSVKVLHGQVIVPRNSSTLIGM